MIPGSLAATHMLGYYLVFGCVAVILQSSSSIMHLLLALLTRPHTSQQAPLFTSNHLKPRDSPNNNPQPILRLRRNPIPNLDIRRVHQRFILQPKRISQPTQQANTQTQPEQSPARYSSAGPARMSAGRSYSMHRQRAPFLACRRWFCSARGRD